MKHILLVLSLFLCVTASAQYQPRPLTLGTGSTQALPATGGTGTWLTLSGTTTVQTGTNSKTITATALGLSIDGDAIITGSTLLQMLTRPTNTAVPTITQGTSNSIYLGSVFRKPDGSEDTRLWMVYSTDGINFSYRSKVPWSDPRGGQYLVHDPSWIKDGDIYYVAYNNHGPAHPFTTFSIIHSTDLINWSYPVDVDVSAAASLFEDPLDQVFSPVWFRDNDDSIHIIVAIGHNDTHEIKLCELHPTGTILNNVWSTPVALNGVPLHTWNPTMIHSENGYEVYFNHLQDESFFGGYQTNRAVAPTITGTYVADDPTGWQPYWGWNLNYEGPSVVALSGTARRFYQFNMTENQIYYSDLSDSTGAFDPSSTTVSTPAPVVSSLANLDQGIIQLVDNFPFSYSAGQPITAVLGTWNPSPDTRLLQWQASTDGTTWSDIGGETSGTYTPPSGGVVRLKETAVSAIGLNSLPAYSVQSSEIRTGTSVGFSSDSIVAYYRFEESSGDRTDATGNGNTLTDNGSVGSATGHVGNCAVFTGTEKLTTSNSLHSGDFSYSGWIKVDSYSGVARAIGDDGFITGTITVYEPGDGTNIVFAVGAGDPGVFGTITYGQWQHVAGTFNAGTGEEKFYINGALVGTRTGNNSPESGSTFEIGFGLNGSLDEIGVWSRVLTGDEISGIYNGGTLP